MLLCHQFLTSKALSVPVLVNFSVTNIKTGQSEEEMKLVDFGQYKSIEHESRKRKIVTNWAALTADGQSFPVLVWLKVKSGLCISWERLRVGLSLVFIFGKYKSPAVLGLKCNGGSFRGARGEECCCDVVRISYCLHFLLYHLQFWLLG